ncbi:hypothetical protein [Spirosoma endbachense]|uniref:Uncharacterized protein n=1 Tax=Spirosoma endbachense TaxID=2666025 RepID=A0A6P1VWZ3_9BACT|nr:hypothetical protein [Spirosoma endbachense]QHV97154.1 hypothetical protein GJR95_20015 [Spirosoma endbachense]
MNTKLMFLALGLLLLIVSFWVEGDAFDIQLYATYYVIGWGSLFRGIGLLCCLVGGVYFLLKRQVSRQQ